MDDPGRTLLYADETIEPQLVDFLLWSGLSVESSAGSGLVCRSPRAHLDEARRRGRILLTRDDMFTDADVFPLDELRRTGVIVVTTSGDDDAFGGVLYTLIAIIGPAGTTELLGHKVELRGRSVVHHVTPPTKRARTAASLPQFWSFSSRRVAQA